eukprot:COSAG04_NODE_132_length_24268_cov_7.633426_17_plen_130_part_00
MHHFDLGWDDTIAIVLQMYLNESGTFEWRDSYAPGQRSVHPSGLLDRTLDAIDALRKRGGPERLVFTTWSYLISMYIDCPPNAGFPCPSAARVKCAPTCPLPPDPDPCLTPLTPDPLLLPRLAHHAGMP